tara:strand:+ start:204 stop:920 length:717 start_codon:yes stop_codon:yes gene_type:complete
MKSDSTNTTKQLKPEAIAAELDRDGFARLPGLISPDVCQNLHNLFSGPEDQFRSVIHMARYNFGRGTYKYFSYPLPPAVQQLREQLYAVLAPVANDWAARLGATPDWPATLAELLERCRAAEQDRPTPLILHYGAGDYNCLHQDIYGDIHFPLQVIIGLSDPEEDYEGGELVLTEQRPRMQSRPMVLRPAVGEGVVIPVRERPVSGKRGWYRTQIRHGVSEITRGERFTLGLIFHDAR